MAKFNLHYSNLLNQSPPSIKNDIWKRLTTRMHNPLTEEQARDIHPDVEALLIREVDSYAKKKGRLPDKSGPDDTKESKKSGATKNTSR